MSAQYGVYACICLFDLFKAFVYIDICHQIWRKKTLFPSHVHNVFSANLWYNYQGLSFVCLVPDLPRKVCMRVWRGPSPAPSHSPTSTPASDTPTRPICCHPVTEITGWYIYLSLFLSLFLFCFLSFFTLISHDSFYIFIYSQFSFPVSFVAFFSVSLFLIITVLFSYIFSFH